MVSQKEHDVLERCKRDLLFLGQKILGYDDADPVRHGEMCRFIEGPHPRKMLVGARGTFKTSFGTIARAIQLCLQDPNHRILIVQNTLDNAKLSVGEIRDHFERNVLLGKIAKDIIPTQRHNRPWSDQNLELQRPGIFSEPTISAAGVDTQLGRRHFTAIIGDDVVAASRDDLKEGGIIILRQEDIEKAIGWHRVNLPGLSVRRKGGKHDLIAQYTVNRWAVQDFARHIMDKDCYSPEHPRGFKVLVLSAHDKEGNLNFPNILTEEELHAIKRSQGDFIFWTQYECEPYNPADRGFPADLNAYWSGKLPKGWQDMKRFALMDLADTTKPNSCFTAFIVLGVDENNHLWIAEASRQRVDTIGKLDMIHRYLKQYDLHCLHVEENLHKETLKYVLKNEMERRGEYYNVVPLKHKNRNKDARILRLQPHHEAHAIHVRREHKELLEEMRDYPHSHYRDLLDTLGYSMDLVKGAPRRMAIAETGQLEDINTMTLRDIKLDMRRVHNLQYGRGVFHLQNRPAIRAG